MKKCLCLVLALCAAAAASNTRGARDLEAQKNALGPEERDLMLLGERSCPFRKAVVFFNVTTKIRSRDAECGDRKLSQIGKMINTQLRELGIGEDVVELADTVFHARVCKVPETNSPTQDGDRELWTPWSTWMGGGACRDCGGDNGDGRRNLLSSSASESIKRDYLSSDTSESFKDVFDSMFDRITDDIEDDLKARITKQLAYYHPCIGSTPEVEIKVDGLILDSAPEQVSKIQCVGKDLLAEVLEDAV